MRRQSVGSQSLCPWTERLTLEQAVREANAEGIALGGSVRVDTMDAKGKEQRYGYTCTRKACGIIRMVTGAVPMSSPSA